MRISSFTVAAELGLLVLAGCSGGGGGGSGGGPGSGNRPPVFSSPTSASVVENSSQAYQAVAADPDGTALTFSLVGGADAARFTVDAAGQLQFVTPPDFDLPGDADGDNVYNVQIRVSDGQANVDQTIAITVTNSREGIAVRRVATGFNQPVFVAAIPGDSRVYVLEKTGTVYLLDPATGTRQRAFTVGNIATDGERGLLGMALVRRYGGSDIAALVVATAPDGAVEVRDYPLPQPDAIGTYNLIIRTPHGDFSNHNGGWIGVGPDGNIYVAIGDGGGSGDPGNNAQNVNSRLGKIIRIAPNPDPYAGAGVLFWIPAPGNPFAGGGGDPWVFATGLRNPFRASFFGDRLFIGDVGQDAREEIDTVLTSQPGRNFGWRFLEGTAPYAGTAPAGLTPPVAEYGHGTGPRQGNSVVGGYVYRGPVTSLRDRYVFGDFVRGHIWSVPRTQLVDGQTLAAARFERRNEDFAPDVGTINQLVSFGEDDAGNLFLVDFDGDIFMVVPG
ncbi:PQQ-dependent sugar dehydrogenase [Sandarakinorhabdus oryzae]|uniref:PQQ-dependent sugar dehydrogenase n=1 Tax=Sandarakinorhabdus oryzae TaxID=2675220 RepID=UPI0012E31996|nr:PQQ-dependent sugar dehydrogenase [Sandarakinorhabdus oryzae]